MKGNSGTKIVIANRRNEQLVGMLHETGSREVVVLCHGFRSNKENKILKNIAVALEKEGISALRFDFSGNGESEGSFCYGNFNKEADDDLHSVMQYLSNTMRRVVPVILGHSKGGDVVLLYASKYGHNIRSVVNISGRFDLRKGIRLGDDYMEKIKEQGFIDATEGKSCFRVTEESLMDRLNTDMHQACLKITKQCQVLTVHGSDDTVVPVEDAKEFAKIIPNHKLEIVQGANHGYTKHQEQLVSTVMVFIKTRILEQPLSYVAKLEDGTIFERKGAGEGEPLVFVTDEEQLIVGLDKAVATMKRGEKAVVKTEYICSVNFHLDSKKEVETTPAYPEICFAVDDFVSTFDAVVLTEKDHCYCVLLNSHDGAASPSANVKVGKDSSDSNTNSDSRSVN